MKEPLGKIKQREVRRGGSSMVKRQDSRSKELIDLASTM
jgi:hypothetical protein